MANEPENLTLPLLQEIRSEVGGVRAKLGKHDKRFDTLERMIREWQETSATSLGFAAHASTRIEAIKERLLQFEGRH